MTPRRLKDVRELDVLANPELPQPVLNTLDEHVENAWDVANSLGTLLARRVQWPDHPSEQVEEFTWAADYAADSELFDAETRDALIEAATETFGIRDRAKIRVDGLPVRLDTAYQRAIQETGYDALTPNPDEDAIREAVENPAQQVGYEDTWNVVMGDAVLAEEARDVDPDNMDVYFEPVREGLAQEYGDEAVETVMDAFQENIGKAYAAGLADIHGSVIDTSHKDLDFPVPEP